MATGDFDAILGQAVDARDPDAIDIPHTVTLSEQQFTIRAVQRVLEHAPERRKPAVAMLIAELGSQTAGWTQPSDAFSRAQLRHAASLGSAVAAVRLAAIIESMQEVDLVEAHALYRWAGSRWDTARTWDEMDDDERLKAQQITSEMKTAFRKPQVADKETIERVSARATLRGVRDRIAGSSSAQSDDSHMHGLAALELSGYQSSFEPNLQRHGPAVRRLYLDHRSRQADCNSMQELGTQVQSREIRTATGRRRTTEEADFIWSAALYKMAAECFAEGDSREEALKLHRRMSALIVHYRRSQIDERIAAFRADAVK